MNLPPHRMRRGRIRRMAVALAMVAGASVVAGCVEPPSKPGAAPASAAQATPPGPPRPQDDFYRAVNGGWLASNEIPADRPSWSAFVALRDEAVTALKSVIDDAKAAGANGTADQKKIVAIYDSFMDEAKLDGLGAKPIVPQMRAIDAIRSKRELPAVIAQFNEIGITAPFSVSIAQDPREPTRYIPTIDQSGLGLPDRAYYLDDADGKLKAMRAKYAAHVAKMLALAGVPDADIAATRVLDIETRLARAQRTRVQNRDPVATDNRTAVGALDALTPGFAWKSWLATSGIGGRAGSVIVAQPGYLEGFGETVEAMPLDAWKAYLKYHVIASVAPYLSRPFGDENFAFESVLSDTPVEMARWKRAVGVVESTMGQGLGRLYVAKYFPPQNKARIGEMVRSILAAYKQEIDGLDWMGPATKKEALAKLARLDAKIAYPSRWRDDTALVVRSDDLLGNVMRARRFEYNRHVARLGRAVDRAEWSTTPQTVDASYDSRRNEIVFPAAILQPPFFDPKADDATNYGAIGAVIGHEISHGFDDRGSQFDGDGRLRNWWTDEDRARFTAKVRALIAQYDAFEPVPGYHVDGALTLGENIADNAGLSIAFRAYRLSLDGKPSPVVDGKTGEQRFYIAFATIYRNNVREAQAIRQIKSDPHSPGEFRVNGTMRNQSPFYEAFDVGPGDAMYLPPERRVTIW